MFHLDLEGRAYPSRGQSRATRVINTGSGLSPRRLDIALKRWPDYLSAFFAKGRSRSVSAPLSPFSRDIFIHCFTVSV